jgi:diguanylate cyclase (GGDEF)-like protein
MVRGEGPRVAPNSQQIQAYVEAPIGQQVDIAAYIGIPLCHKDGTLFGTLCAIDPTPQPESIKQEGEFIELQTRLLTTILHYELKAQENARCYERAKLEAEMDILTGVYNRRGWERLLRAEEERCRQFGLSASILVIDLDNLKEVNDTQGHVEGDRLIQATAKCLLNNIRSEDVLARVGGDEFVILIIETNLEITQQVVKRIQEKLEENNLKASVGWAIRIHQSTLPKTFIEADKNMFHNKSERKKLC